MSRDCGLRATDLSWNVFLDDKFSFEFMNLHLGLTHFGRHVLQLFEHTLAGTQPTIAVLHRVTGLGEVITKKLQVTMVSMFSRLRTGLWWPCIEAIKVNEIKVIQLNIGHFIWIELNVVVYQSIGLGLLYLKSFESDAI